jgi:DNA-binding HxlR family transcriptional regulator
VVSAITVAPTLDHMAPSRNRFSPDSAELTGEAVGSNQLCPVAAATDLLGDQWSVLLLRDLLWHGPQTESRLAERNPGLDAGGVAGRLDRLCTVGLAEPHPLDGEPAPGYRLTALGRAADVVIRALNDFGLGIVRQRPITPAMISQVVAAAAVDRQHDLVRTEVSALIELDVSGRTVGVVLAPGILRVDDTLGADVAVACTQDVFVDLLSGLVRVDDAVRRGELDVQGPTEPVVVLFELLARS